MQQRNFNKSMQLIKELNHLVLLLHPLHQIIIHMLILRIMEQDFRVLKGHKGFGQVIENYFQSSSVLGPNRSRSSSPSTWMLFSLFTSLGFATFAAYGMTSTVSTPPFRTTDYVLAWHNPKYDSFILE